ncbi:hypothetical protein MICRO80W_150009 [Micrococcus luteus]|nr:hypothetical protein MICRO116_650065 [Micrococcus sp. 116]VWX48377.1 hypothetical protein MICRO80W_150009 [Micrococcus luteus]
MDGPPGRLPRGVPPPLPGLTPHPALPVPNPLHFRPFWRPFRASEGSEPQSIRGGGCWCWCGCGCGEC